MNFFEHQDRARRQTRLLAVLFVVAVSAILLFVNSIVGAGVNYWVDINENSSPEHLHKYVSLAVIFVICSAILFRMKQLSKGGSAVAEMVGARLVTNCSNHHYDVMFRNVVEEMSIASGTPVPRLYIMDNENAINAFAAGYSIDDAAIVITRGAVVLLNRDELQGIIAHEFSHIFSGDMRFNIRLMGLLYGIEFIGNVGARMVYSMNVILGSGFLINRKFRKSEYLIFYFCLPIFGIPLLILGYIGLFFGRIIKSAISRQREYLADASAVQFTRNSSGILGAFNKIRAHILGSHVSNCHVEEISHFFFSTGFERYFFPKLLATHPSIEERISLVDPSFDLTAPLPILSPIMAEPLIGPGKVYEAREKTIDAPSFVQNMVFATEDNSSVLIADSLLSSIGSPTAEHLVYATMLYGKMPSIVKEQVHSYDGAKAIIYVLLLDKNAVLRGQQLELIKKHKEVQSAEIANNLYAVIDSLGIEYRLPLIDLCLSSLRILSEAEQQCFLTVTRALIDFDNKVTLKEFIIQTLLSQHLMAGKRSKTIVKYKQLKPVLPDCAILLSLVAYIGHRDQKMCSSAFELGMTELGIKNTQLLDKSFIKLEEVKSALDKLRMLETKGKLKILRACAKIVLADSKVKIGEIEILRMIADTLECPMPPFLYSTKNRGGAQSTGDTNTKKQNISTALSENTTDPIH